MEIEELLANPECEWLDFKNEHHKDTAELVHDILCLSNAWTKKNRFLVFGIADDGQVVGVENDTLRRTLSDIYDLLRSAKLNRYPKLLMKTLTIEAEHEIDILSIKNEPEKPYFLLVNKQRGRNLVRAGVIYTRLGDTNIPMNETAPESLIELLWRERFGLDQTPFQLAQKLLSKTSSWIKIEGDDYIYNKKRPEFVLKTGDVLVENFSTPWSCRFPDKSASSYSVNLLYYSTTLKKYTFVHCDGYRYRIPFPSQDGGRYIIDADSDQWKIAQIYWQYYPIENSITRVGIELINNR